MKVPEQNGVCLAVGFFDGVHLGHRRILAGANAVLTFRNHPQSVLAPPSPALLMDADERISLLATLDAPAPRAVRAMPFTRAFASRSPEQFAAFLLKTYPNLARVHCGANWRFGADGAGTPASLRAMGFDVKIARYAAYKGHRISSTRIREALAEGAIEDANAMLGRPFAVSGPVLSGKGVGRTLGAPTLNVAAAPPLRLGAYAVETTLGRGVANYGVAPTMRCRAWTKPLLEVHLFDGAALAAAPLPAKMRVSFLAFLRPEAAFASCAALRRQIAADIAAAQGVWRKGRRERQTKGGI